MIIIVVILSITSIVFLLGLIAWDRIWIETCRRLGISDRCAMKEIWKRIDDLATLESEHYTSDFLNKSRRKKKT